MRLGTAYPIRKLKGHAYALTNISEVPVELVVDVAPPLEGSLRPLYEPPPDLSWVKVSPRQFTLQPGQSSDSEVTIRVPEDAHWKDRNFQCALYAHTLQGSFVNVGIYDKVLFSTGAGPEAMKRRGPRLELVPATLRLGKLRPGKTYDASKFKVRLRVRNNGEPARRVALAAAPFDAPAAPPKGWTPAPDPGALRFEGPVALAGAQTADALFTLELPGPAAGRRWAYRVRAAAVDGAIPEGYATVLVEGSEGKAGKAKKK